MVTTTASIQACLVLFMAAASHLALHVVHANFGLVSRRPLPTIVLEQLHINENPSMQEKSFVLPTSSSNLPTNTRHQQFHPGGIMDTIGGEGTGGGTGGGIEEGIREATEGTGGGAGGGTGVGTGASEGPFSNRRNTCHLLRLSHRQRKMCRRDRGVATPLVEAVKLSIKACQALFQYDRWNCTLIDKYRTQIMRKGRGFREVSFLHALTAASMTYTFSKACSAHVLDRCTCDNPEAWKWGGCGDNVPYAGRFTRRFLAQRRGSEDIQATVDLHNIIIGIRVVRKGRKRQCKCHGVSGSCSFKTCWHRVAPFWETAKKLKDMYKAAKKKQIGENGSQHGARILKYNGLAYTEKSPNFCAKSQFAPGISDRFCNNTETCDEMCCGRGYNVHLVKVKQRCRCLFTWCCHVSCEACLVQKEVYTCK